MATLPIPHPADEVIGSVRTFGDYGPMYEVTGYAAPDEDGDPQVSLIVIESGETLDYSLQSVLADPLKP